MHHERLLLVTLLFLAGCTGKTSTISPSAATTELPDGTQFVVLKLPAMV